MTDAEGILLHILVWKHSFFIVNERKGHPQAAKVGDERSLPHLQLLTSPTPSRIIKRILSNPWLHIHENRQSSILQSRVSENIMPRCFTLSSVISRA